MKTYAGTQAQVVSLSQSVAFDSTCTLSRSIKAADGLTIAAFIAKAFNDEFKLAGIYSGNGIKITGEITKIEFSKPTMFQDGHWNISLNLESSNGKTLPASHHYSFSPLLGSNVCHAVATALIPAVPDLIKKAVLHPQFGSLLEQ